MAGIKPNHFTIDRGDNGDSSSVSSPAIQSKATLLFSKVHSIVIKMKYLIKRASA